MSARTRAKQPVEIEVKHESPLYEGLTPEQREAVAHVDGPLLVLAGPGSGKTTVVTRRVAHLIEQGIPPWQILALTFTNKAAGEMAARIEKLISNGDEGDDRRRRGLTVSTFHAFCARILRRYAEQAGLSQNYTIFDSGDQKDAIKRALEQCQMSSKNWQPASVASQISAAKNKLLDAKGFAAEASDFYSRSIAKIFAAYENILKESDALDFDDLLMNVASLLRHNEHVRSELQNRYQYILIDEYQDTNHAQFIIAHTLASAHGNICVVGDPDQCLIPGTLINTSEGDRPIEEISEGDQVRAAAGWGSANYFTVDKVMRSTYRGPLITIVTEDGKRISATPNHIGFARLQSCPELHYTYLMWKRGLGFRIGTTRGVRASKDGEIVSGLQVRTNQEVADAMWVLHCASSSAEACYYEQYYSLRYGVPTMVSFVRGRRMNMDQSWIDRLYHEIDSADGAAKLMGDLHLDARFPHHRPGAVTRENWCRRHVVFTMFGDNRPHGLRPWHEHRVQLVTSDQTLRDKAVATNGLNVRDGQRGTWRIETSRKDYDRGVELAEQIAGLDADIDIVSRARLTDQKAFQFMPFSHLHPGMIIPVFEEGRIVDRTIKTVTRENYDGPVYDLSVPHARNYAADDVIVHNSIYGWRGADITNILEFEEHYPQAVIIPLGRNFRSTAHILAAADSLIKNNKRRKLRTLSTDLGEGEKPTVMIAVDEHHEAEVIVREFQQLNREKNIAWKDMAILYRMNALSRVLEDAFRSAGIPYVIARGTAFYERKEVKDALSYLRLIVNPRDELSLRRVINTPTRGIGKTSIEKIELFAINHQISLLEAMGRVDEIDSIATKTQNAIKRFVKMVADWRRASEPNIDRDGVFAESTTAITLPDLVGRVVKESGLEGEYKKNKTEEDEQRVANLNELVSAAAEFLTRPIDPDDPRGETANDGMISDLARYLESIALVSDSDAIDPENGAVTLLTLHAAKGLEFEAVALAGLEEGLLPHMRSIGSDHELEEERRLCFVGITRAKRHLIMTRAVSRTLRGLRERQIESQFVRELPGENVNVLDLSGGFGDDLDNEDFADGRYGSGASGWGRSSYATGNYGRRNSTSPSLERSPRYEMDADAAAHGLSIGALVRHPTFGVGRVEAITKRPAGSSARVKFQSVGVKTLILEYAKLELIDPS